MENHEKIDVEDVGEALKEGRELREALKYRVQFANGNLDFRPIEIDDPLPLGRQIVTAGGLDLRDGVSLFAILAGGDFEDVRLDETFDLRGKGAERFVAFVTDRDFKLTINDHQLEWGKPLISGSELTTLAEISDDQAIFLEVRGGEDRLIELDELVDLNQPGIERFIVAANPNKLIEIIVNARRRVVAGNRVTFEQVVQIAFPGTPEPNTVFSMTYRKAASAPHAGELGPNGVVIVKKGTIFNVTKTIQS